MSVKYFKQFGFGEKRNKEIENKTDDLMNINKKLKNYEGIIGGLTNSVILIFTLAILIISYLVVKDGDFKNIIIPKIILKLPMNIVIIREVKIPMAIGDIV